MSEYVSAASAAPATVADNTAVGIAAAAAASEPRFTQGATAEDHPKSESEGRQQAGCISMQKTQTKELKTRAI
jgi:hypothetical protein